MPRYTSVSTTMTTKIAIAVSAEARGLTVDQALRFLLKHYLFPDFRGGDPIESYNQRNAEMMDACRRSSPLDDFME